MKRISFGNVFAGALVASFGAAVYLGCGSPDSLPGGDGGGAGNGGGGIGGVTIIPTVVLGGASGSSGGGQGGTAGTTGGAEGICGDTSFNANRVPVDVFIVLDRSGSMAYSISEDCYCSGSRERCRDTANCTDRLTAVRGAVEQTLNANPTINWGLELYSSPGASNQCAVSLTPQVPISASSSPAIIAELANMDAGNYTPTAAAVNAANMYLQTVNDGNSKVILLATDGMPNCAGGRASDDDDMPAATAAVAGARAAGFPVYVVGMGPQESIAQPEQPRGGGRNRPVLPGRFHAGAVGRTRRHLQNRCCRPASSKRPRRRPTTPRSTCTSTRCSPIRWRPRRRTAGCSAPRRRISF